MADGKKDGGRRVDTGKTNTGSDHRSGTFSEQTRKGGDNTTRGHGNQPPPSGGGKTNGD